MPPPAARRHPRFSTVPALFNGSPRWLEVTMDFIAFGPRMALHSVPYAFRAGVAEDVQCLTPPCVQDAEVQSISASKITGTVASATNATNATNASCATSAGSATNATNAGYATNAGNATNAVP